MPDELMYERIEKLDATEWMQAELDRGELAPNGAHFARKLNLSTSSCDARIIAG